VVAGNALTGDLLTSWPGCDAVCVAVTLAHPHTRYWWVAYEALLSACLSLYGYLTLSVWLWPVMGKSHIKS